MEVHLREGVKKPYIFWSGWPFVWLISIILSIIRKWPIYRLSITFSLNSPKNLDPQLKAYYYGRNEQCNPKHLFSVIVLHVRIPLWGMALAILQSNSFNDSFPEDTPTLSKIYLLCPTTVPDANTLRNFKQHLFAVKKWVSSVSLRKLCFDICQLGRL